MSRTVGVTTENVARALSRAAASSAYSASVSAAITSAIGAAPAATVEDLAALKALVSRPKVVIVEGGIAGGEWEWESGSSTTANDFTVVACTAGEAGRYKKVVVAGAWPSTFGSSPTAVNSIDFGSYPTAGKIPAGVMEQFAASMIVPATYTQQPWPNVNFAAYAENQGTTSGKSVVNYFGLALANGALGYAAGFNSVVGNVSSANPFTGAGLGGNFGLLVGLEVNPNIRKVGASAPTGSVEGIRLIGGGDDTRPLNGAYGINLFPLAGWETATLTYWTSFLFSQDGAISTPANDSYFANMGATGAGNSVHSQAIKGRARNGAGTDLGGYLQFAYTNNWYVNPALLVGSSSVAMDTNALLQTYVSSASFQTSAVLRNDNGGANTAVSLGFNVATTAEAALSKLGIGVTRNNTYGRGYGSLYANNAADTTGIDATVERVRWDHTGLLVFGTVGLSGAVTVGSTTLITSSVNFTDGAAAASGTLLNAPAAGNPTKWIPIVDNGTTRYIPAW